MYVAMFLSRISTFKVVFQLEKSFGSISDHNLSWSFYIDIKDFAFSEHQILFGI